MARWPWFDRPFPFDFPPEKMPELLERLRGTPARLEERLRGVPRETLVRQDGAGWTIQENVGHLLDLEALHLARIEDIRLGRSDLTAADLQNRRTQEAHHNDRAIADLLAAFRRERMNIVGRFEALGEAYWARGGMHPRLKKPMRLVDLAYFWAEHDDYHLARIGELLRTLAPP